MALLLACEAPRPATPISDDVLPAPHVAPEPQAPYHALVYAELTKDDGPLAVRTISLATRATRDVAEVAPKLDARFALSPDERTLAILEKADLHRERAARWRLRLVDLASGAERELLASRVDPDVDAPWDVGWSRRGDLLLASRRGLFRLSPDGARALVRAFAADTLGVTFRDPAHGGLVVSQTASAYAVHVIADDAREARLVAERPLAGIAGYARRPGTDEVVELMTRFDGAVTLALFGGREKEAARPGEALPPGRPSFDETVRLLEGPRVDGLVELIGATRAGVYLVWPVAREDRAAIGTRGTAFYFRVDYGGTATLLDGTRNWGAAGTIGMAPDGSALLVATGQRAGSARFALALCCAARPARELLPPGDRVVIGWLSRP